MFPSDIPLFRQTAQQKTEHYSAKHSVGSTAVWQIPTEDEKGLFVRCDFSDGYPKIQFYMCGIGAGGTFFVRPREAYTDQNIQAMRVAAADLIVQVRELLKPFGEQPHIVGNKDLWKEQLARVV